MPRSCTDGRRGYGQTRCCVFWELVSHGNLVFQRTCSSLKFRIRAVLENREARQANLAMLVEVHSYTGSCRDAWKFATGVAGRHQRVKGRECTSSGSWKDGHGTGCLEDCVQASLTQQISSVWGDRNGLGGGCSVSLMSGIAR